MLGKMWKVLSAPPGFVAVLLVLLAVVAWFTTGWWIEDDTTRMWLRILLLVVALAIEGATLTVWALLLRQDRARAQAAGAYDPAARARVALQHRVDKAMAALGVGEALPWSRPDGRRWFLVIGLPGAGKTQLLRSSGGVVRALDGSGGPPPATPTMEVTFVQRGEDALVDLPGNVVAGGPEDVTMWQTLLDVLRRDRRVPHPAAVLVCVSVADLVGAPPEGVAGIADRLVQRLRELSLLGGQRIEAQVILTHADALSGFDELVSGLDGPDRARPLGRAFAVPPPSDAEGRREVAYHLRDLRDALERVSQEQVSHVRSAAGRARLLALPAEVAALEPALATLFGAIASVDEVALAGMWFTGGGSGPRSAPWSARLAASVGMTPSAAPPQQPTADGATMFAGRLLDEVAGRVSGGVTTEAARRLTTRRRVSAALAAATFLFVGLAEFVVARHEISHLEAVQADLQTLADATDQVREDPTRDPWEVVVQTSARLTEATRPGVLEAQREAGLPEATLPDVEATWAWTRATRRWIREPVKEAVHAAVASLVIGDLTGRLVRTAKEAGSGLGTVDPEARQLTRRETETMLLALDTHALSSAWGRAVLEGWGDAPELCDFGSLPALGRRMAGLRELSSPAIGDLAALLLSDWVATLPTSTTPYSPADQETLDALGRRVERIRPEIRQFNALLARVADRVPARPAGAGLDGVSWRVDEADWRPDALDDEGCVAFHQALADGVGGGACAVAAADPSLVARLYADHHEEQWRHWWSHIQLADVNENPESSATDVAAELRRVMAPGRDLDRILGRLGRGEAAAAVCAAESPPAACCDCACVKRPWRIAAKLAAGQSEAWTSLQNAADQLATAIDGLQGGTAADLVVKTYAGEGPFVAYHDALRRVVGSTTADDQDLPEGCTCPDAPKGVTENELRSRLEGLGTTLIARAWYQVLRAYDDHLHQRWNDEVLTGWNKLSSRFPFSPDAAEDAAPADVQALLGCSGALGAFLNSAVKPVMKDARPRWGRAADLGWTAEAKSLMSGFEVMCRRADGLDRTGRVWLGLQYQAGGPTPDVRGMRVTVDGRGLTYQFGQALDGVAMSRTTSLGIEAMRGNPPKAGCPRYSVSTGDWPLYRMLAKPLVEQLRTSPPYDRKGLAFHLASETETCGSTGLGHKIEYREDTDGPAATYFVLSRLALPQRLFRVDLPN